jgi:hypothetical protein
MVGFDSSLPSSTLSRPDGPSVQKKREQFSSKLTRLNKKSPAFPTLIKVRNAISNFFETCPLLNWSRNSDRVWGIHVAAEHMSKDVFGWNASEVALSNTIRRLNETGGGQARQLALSLDYALRIEKLASAVFFLAARKVKKDVRNLKPGEFLFIPTNTSQHAIITEVWCTGEDPNGKKLYSVIVHNTGDGLQFHHSRLIDTGPSRKVQYQTAYEIIDISEESLCGEKSSFFQKLFFARSRETDFLYSKVFPSLDGSLARAKPDHRPLWGHGQLGGSCTASCILALLRAHMEPEQFREFKESVRQEMLLKMYEQIRKGGGGTHTIDVALEIARKLNQEAAAKGRSSPEISRAIEIMEKQGPQRVEEGAASKSPLPLAKRKQSLLGAADYLSEAFEMIKREGIYTSERHQHIMNYLLKAKKSSRIMSSEEKKDLEKVASRLAAFIKKDRPFAKGQIYACSALVSLFLDRLDLPSRFNDSAIIIFKMYSKVSKREIQTDKEMDIFIRKFFRSKAPKASSEQSFRLYQQLALAASSNWQNALRHISDKETAIGIAKNLLKKNKCFSVRLVCSLIANPNVRPGTILKELSLEELQPNQQHYDYIASALQARLITECLGSKTGREKIEECNKRFKDALEAAKQSGIHWYAALITAYEKVGGNP